MYRAGVVTILCLAALVPAQADHCPDDSIAAGPSEKKMAKIGFERGDFSKVLRRYGPPDAAHEEADSSYPTGSGEARYSWRVGTARLEVFTMYYHDGGRRTESVVAVRVDGAAPVRGLETKRGLRLGDAFERVVELYGPVFVSGTVNGWPLPGEARTVCFADGTELGVGVDANGRVTAIWLAPSAE
jgi:hypothetical protein